MSIPIHQFTATDVVTGSLSFLPDSAVAFRSTFSQEVGGRSLGILEIAEAFHRGLEALRDAGQTKAMATVYDCRARVLEAAASRGVADVIKPLLQLPTTATKRAVAAAAS